jgi:protein-tyrosine phosphatase
MTTRSSFRILAVCTGNICRSPMVERLLQSEFAALAPGEFEISSAGTAALVGSTIDAQVAEFVKAYNGDPEGFHARQLEARLLENQDLILALTREHRAQIVQMSPSLLRRTFTLREFARLITTAGGDPSLDGPNRWRAVLPKVVRARSIHPTDPLEDDVVDPYRRPAEVYEQMVRELVPATNTLVEWENAHR